MTLPELYEALERHDWFHAQSDDQSIHLAGREQWKLIDDAAEALGPQGEQLLLAFICHKTAPAQLPKPKLEDYV